MNERTKFDCENYNRVFILGGKENSADDFRDAFQQYGSIKDVYVVRDKTTRESKGVCYITFAKASEAALAIEEMNGKYLDERSKPLKVLLANSRVEGNVRDSQEEEKMRRLFIMVPKTFTSKDIEDEFKQYGEIEYVRLVTEKGTSTSRGLAYVKYTRAYHAAIALETCESSFRAVFASNKKTTDNNGSNASQQRRGGGNDSIRDGRRGNDFGTRSASGRRGDDNGRPYGGGDGRGYSSSVPDIPGYGASSARFGGSTASGFGMSSGGYGASSAGFGAPPSVGFGSGTPYAGGDVIDDLRMYRNTGETTLEVITMNTATQEQVTKLFGLIPGLVYCDYDSSRGHAVVKYSMPQLAAYARDHFDGFEFPIGCRMVARFARDRDTNKYGGRYDDNGQESQVASTIMAMKQNMNAAQGPDSAQGIAALMQTIQAATSILQQVGISGDAVPPRDAYSMPSASSSAGIEHFCSASLPRRQPMFSKDTPVQMRLFLVSNPDVFPESVAEDLFCRFGNLISAYFMPGKNFGYVKYADARSATDAMETLNGQTFYGNQLKVIPAEPARTTTGGATGGATREKRGRGAEDDISGYHGKHSRRE